jgi:hypothetical protein
LLRCFGVVGEFEARLFVFRDSTNQFSSQFEGFESSAEHRDD